MKQKYSKQKFIESLNSAMQSSLSDSGARTYPTVVERGSVCYIYKEEEKSSLQPRFSPFLPDLVIQAGVF